MVEAFFGACEDPATATEEVVRGLSIVAVLEAMDRSMHSNGSAIKVNMTRVEEFMEST